VFDQYITTNELIAYYNIVSPEPYNKRAGNIIKFFDGKPPGELNLLLRAMYGWGPRDARPTDPPPTPTPPGLTGALGPPAKSWDQECMQMAFYHGANVGAAGNRVWFSAFKSYSTGSGMNYYPGCDVHGCDAGAGVCRGMVTHASKSFLPAKFDQVNSDAKFSTGSALGVEARPMLQCISPALAEAYKLAVTKVLMLVGDEHTWLWPKLRVGSSAANQARYTVVGDVTSHAHSSPYEYYMMYAAIMEIVQVDAVRRAILEDYELDTEAGALRAVGDCLSLLPDETAGGMAIEDRWI
jgi:hypothetical protein